MKIKTKRERHEAWGKIREVFERYSFPYRVVLVKGHERCWTGQCCNIIDPTRSYEQISNAIHEFAHWLVAAPCRKEIPDFGLGFCSESSYWWMSDNESTVSGRYAQTEEERASVLGIMIEEALNLDPEWTIEFHNWHEFDGKFGGKFARAQAWLQNKGLLDKNNNFRLRPKK